MTPKITLKLLIKILTGITITCILSCHRIPDAIFLGPQPANKKNLTKIPNRLRGYYKSNDDETFLSIGDSTIERLYDYEIKMNIHELDSNMVLSGDTIVDTINQVRTPIKRVGDTLISYYHDVFVLFRLSDRNLIRKSRGYYFSNVLQDSLFWEVQKIKIRGKQLIISRISGEQDIEILKEIANKTVEDSSKNFAFEVTQGQFYEFINRGGFKKIETFERRKKNVR